MIIVYLFLPVSMICAGSTQITVSIDTVSVSTLSEVDTLDIILSAGSELGGFDFKIGSGSSKAVISDVLPGEFVGFCRWDIFNKRSLEIPDVSIASSIWHVVGLADMAIDDTVKAIYSMDHDASLIRLEVQTRERSTLSAPESIPFFFYWDGCSDNTLSSVSGDTLILSSEVRDGFSGKNYPVSSQFPSYTGLTDDCSRILSNPRIQQNLVLRNGGWRFITRPDSTVIDSSDH